METTLQKPPFCCYRLQQLARLGLPDQIFIPALLQELHHEIPSFSNTFCWQDEQGKLSNIYDEMQNTSVIKKFIFAMLSDQPNKNSQAINWVSHLEQPTTSFEQYGKHSYLTDFYKEILLPLKYINSCFIPIFKTETKQRLGVLMIHRKKGEREFTALERQKLQYIATIIANGFQQPETDKMFLTDGWEQGVLVVDKEGLIQQACPMGEKLLSLASFDCFDASTRPLSHNLSAFEFSKKFIKNLFSSHSNKDSNEELVLTLSTHNAWGEFILKGFLIKDMTGNRSDKISLNIRKQEPFVLKLFHRIKVLNLTPRQETVGLFYAAGDPHKTISEKLDLSLYTVKEHIKNIYERLNINSRADLIELIICETKSD